MDAVPSQTKSRGGTAKGITHIGGYAAHINPGGVRRHREGIEHIGGNAAHIDPGGLQGAVAATGQEGTVRWLPGSRPISLRHG